MSILVFRRAWWRRGAKGQLLPNSGGRRTTIARVATVAEAREMCRDWNERRAHKPNPFSVKAEFEHD